MNKMYKISKYISYNEATRSQTAVRHGLDNTPNEEQLQNMIAVATEVFDKVRENFGVPLYVSSFFRSYEVNRKARGSRTSQHMTGEAIDIDCDVYGGVRNIEVLNWIRENLDFDQLIAEYPDKNGNPSWVHVSYSTKRKNRKQVFSIG